MHSVPKSSTPNSRRGLCQFLTDVQNSFTAGNRSKFPTKLLYYFHHTFSMLPHYLAKVRVVSCIADRRRQRRQLSCVGERARVSIATQLNSTSSWVASAGRYRHFADTTQLNLTSSCVRICSKFQQNNLKSCHIWQKLKRLLSYGWIMSQ